MAETKAAKKATSGRWTKYELAGTTLKRKGKFCPKCGAGMFLAEHKDRVTCGNCGYTEFKTKKA
jgi:small subunit ribosomal protein S27Ae